LARKRYKAKQIRLLREEHEQQQLYREKSRLVSNTQDKEAKQQYILQAIERAKAKRKP
jgi:electron transport complex protein RnfB